MAIEAIVRQKDKETTAANIAKLAGKFLSFLKKNKQKRKIQNLFGIFFSEKEFSGSVSTINMSNEVFESIDEPVSSRTMSVDKISTITEVSF